MGEGKDHILSRYDADLLAYRDHVLVMGRQALEQVRNAVQALTGPDVGLARQVLYRERKLNELDMAGQEEGIRLLTVHHPVANDLRLVLALTRSLSDLERIGNQGKKIARISLQNFDTELAAPDPALFADVPIMSEVATRMLADALAAWVKDDFETAVQVAQTDAKLDRLAEMYGGVGNNQGRVAEEFYYNSLKHDPVLNGIRFDVIDKNVTRTKAGIEEEYDLLLINGQDVMIVEVKYRLHPKDIVRLLNRKLGNFLKLFPQYRSYRLHPVLATFSADDDVRRMALERGILVLQRRGHVIETLAA